MTFRQEKRDIMVLPHERETINSRHSKRKYCGLYRELRKGKLLRGRGSTGKRSLPKAKELCSSSCSTERKEGEVYPSWREISKAPSERKRCSSPYGKGGTESPKKEGDIAENEIIVSSHRRKGRLESFPQRRGPQYLKRM